GILDRGRRESRAGAGDRGGGFDRAGRSRPRGRWQDDRAPLDRSARDPRRPARYVTPSAPDDRLDRLLRELAPQVLGAIVRRFHDFAASEDAVQEALIAAAAQWRRDGVPDHPRGWLVRVAERRLIDQLRSDAARRNRETALAAETPVAVDPAADAEPGAPPDHTLVLLL